GFTDPGFHKGPICTNEPSCQAGSHSRSTTGGNLRKVVLAILILFPQALAPRFLLEGKNLLQCCLWVNIKPCPGRRQGVFNGAEFFGIPLVIHLAPDEKAWTLLGMLDGCGAAQKLGIRLTPDRTGGSATPQHARELDVFFQKMRRSRF